MEKLNTIDIITIVIWAICGIFAILMFCGIGTIHTILLAIGGPLIGYIVNVLGDGEIFNW